MSKTQVKTTAKTDAQVRKDLTDLKLAVINIHTGEEMKYVRMNAARDACFTSHNSLAYKTDQMTNLKDEIASLVGDDGEISNVNVERKVNLYGKMENELHELTLRHEADLAAYEVIWEEKWRPGSANKGVGKGDLRKRVSDILGK